MSEKTTCIRCERAIDRWAKLCPYCNWDQSNPEIPVVTQPRETVAIAQPDDLKEQFKKKGLYAGAGVLILVMSFLIGMVINSDDTPENAPEPVLEQEQKKVAPIKRADTPLVPTNERAGLEQPITSAPVQATPDGMSTAAGGYDRSDATAVSSDEYNQLAKRAKAERERMDMLIDPRTLTGAAYAQGRRPAAQRPVQQPAQIASQTPFPAQSPIGAPAVVPPLSGTAPEVAPPPAAATPRPRRAVRTRPVPQYQPIPRISASGTARLTLMIGADGRVRDVNIERALNRNTADLVAAVSKWRFKPATEDGEPVAAPYSVDITFGGR
jgi:TonB family protein